MQSTGIRVAELRYEHAAQSQKKTRAAASQTVSAPITGNALEAFAVLRFEIDKLVEVCVWSQNVLRTAVAWLDAQQSGDVTAAAK